MVSGLETGQSTPGEEALDGGSDGGRGVKDAAVGAVVDAQHLSVGDAHGGAAHARRLPPLALCFVGWGVGVEGSVGGSAERDASDWCGLGVAVLSAGQLRRVWMRVVGKDAKLYCTGGKSGQQDRPHLALRYIPARR